jgi:hypothetical protein
MDIFILLLLNLAPPAIFIFIVWRWLQYGLLPGEDFIDDIRLWIQHRREKY